MSSSNVISRLQSKYGIGIPPFPGKSRKTVGEIIQNNAAIKTFSNANSTLQESLTEGYYPQKLKFSKGSFKKKLSEHNKLPEILVNNRILPKIK